MRYLFCVPHGTHVDMNDICSSIVKGFKHCQKFRRLLIIDTRHNTLVNEDIRNYFLFTPSIIYKDDIDSFYNILNDEELYDCFPQVSSPDYKTHTLSLSKGCIDIKTSYKEDVVFFSGEDNIDYDITEFFKLFTVSQIVKKTVKERLRRLSKDFISIDIRNNTSDFISKNKKDFQNEVLFVTSDDKQSVKKLKLVSVNVFSFDDDDSSLILNWISNLIVSCYGKQFFYSDGNNQYTKNILFLRNNIDIVNKMLA